MKLLLVTLLFTAVWAGKYNNRGGPKAGKLNVHLVPHTHDDVGWLKTVDQYFWGANNTIQNAGVQYILDTVVQNLAKDPARKFIYVETAFFARWWDQQDQATKDLTQQLVDNGQLVFINGGWSMHDEANPHYASMVDQTTFGHRFLKENLGVIPRAGWQIDPFGHSGTQAALMTHDVGFVAFYFARIDYQDYNWRSQSSVKGLEVVWRGSPSLGASADAFAGAFYRTSYGPPGGFDWSAFSDDPPMMDDPNLEGYNVDQRVDEFISYCQAQAGSIRTNNILLTMGSDFQYQDADHWYTNMDKLIHYVNKRNGPINAFYSDPVQYTLEKYNANVTWPLKDDDWFPLENGAHKFWSGFFTSRPAFKRMARYSSSYYNYGRQIIAQTNGDDTQLNHLIQAIGMAMHHDAITGTEKQHTVFDYQKRLAEGRARAQNAVLPGVKKLVGGDKDFQECILANQSMCIATAGVGKTPTGGNNVTVVIYNPSSQVRNEVVSVPIGGPNVEVTFAGQQVKSQVIPRQQCTTNYHAGGTDCLPNIVQFLANGVPPQGYHVYDIHNAKATSTKSVPVKAPITLSNGLLSLTIDGSSGITNIKNEKENIEAKLSQNWMFYRANAGDSVSSQASGAYVFRPEGQTPYPVSATITTSQVQGTAGVSQVVDMKWGDWAYQRVSLDEGSEFAEIDYTIGPIPISDGWGKEVISRFTTDLASDGMYYTDSNGRDMETRKRNYRKYFPFQNSEPVAGNYFPNTVAQFIKSEDNTRQFTVLTDASQSGGSIHDGQIELMVHRRLLHDDHYGVGEPLNETQYITPYHQPGLPNGQHYGPALIIRGKHWVSISTPASAAAAWRVKADFVYYNTQTAFSPMSYVKSTVGSVLSAALPVNVQVMTVERLVSGELLVRLSHQFGVGEDPNLSKPVTIDITKIFTAASGLKITSAAEMSLTANQKVEDIPKLDWRIEGELNKPKPKKVPFKFPMVTLGPMQIRTFLCGTQ